MRARAAKARRRRLERADDRAEGVVYFVGAKTGPIKIGFTTNLPARLRRLQMASPQKLRVLAAFPGSRQDELLEHQLRAQERLHGEWFERSAGTMSIIRWWQKRDVCKALLRPCA